MNLPYLLGATVATGGGNDAVELGGGDATIDTGPGNDQLTGFFYLNPHGHVADR